MHYEKLTLLSAIAVLFISCKTSFRISVQEPAVIDGRIAHERFSVRRSYRIPNSNSSSIIDILSDMQHKREVELIKQQREQ